MSSPDSDLSVSLPPDLRKWLSEEADQQNMESGEFLRSLLEAHRVAQQDGDLSDSKQDINEFRDEFMELVEDVRERVIQVKREADQKAAADHTHPELADQIDQTTNMIADVEAEIERIHSNTQSLETDLERGFENYEDILDHLITETDRLSDRLETVGQAVLDTRNQLREITAAQQRIKAVNELKQAANKHGVTAGECEACGRTVRVGLLTEPKCPHCSSTLTDIEPADGFRRLFGTATLQTGDQPALTGETEPALDEELESQLSEDAPDSAAISWGHLDEDSTEQS